MNPSDQASNSANYRLTAEAVSRRTILRGLAAGAGALGLGGLLAACGNSEGSSASDDGTGDGSGATAGAIAVSVWGGVTEDAIKSSVVPRFREQTGADVLFDTGGASDRFNKLMARKDSPVVDVFINTGELVYSAHDQGVLSSLDTSVVENLSVYEDWARTGDYGASITLDAYGLVRNPDETAPLASWTDLLRPDLSGKVVMPGVTHAMMPGVLVVLAEAYGGSVDDIGPAIEKLKEVDPVILSFFWTQWAPLLQTGEVVAAPEFLYYAATMKEEGMPVEYSFPEEGAIAGLQAASVVRGGNEELANIFVNVLLDREVQEEMAESILQTPSHPEAKIPESVAGKVPPVADLIPKVRFFDHEMFASNRSDWTERLNAEVLPDWT